MSSTFRQLLQVSSETVERPRAVAEGHYIGTIKDYIFGVTTQKKTPYCRILLTPEEETEDVESGANSGIDLSKKEIRRDYYITPAALYMLADMCDAVLGKSDIVIDERLPDLKGQRVMFGIKHRKNDADETDERVFEYVPTIIAYESD
jgi:hypothetical protein